jgi:hypothetical protein
MLGKIHLKQLPFMFSMKFLFRLSVKYVSVLVCINVSKETFPAKILLNKTWHHLNITTLNIIHNIQTA